MRKISQEDSRARVAAALAMVRLNGLEKRFPNQLSGGQQQRVALARAIVIEPVMLLLDEPLSNLDAKLREEMRVEIKEIQSRLKITTVFVTHDQEEALTISDRIAVMHAGQVVQEGTPVDVFEKPRHSFVAGFIGQSNLLRGTAGAEAEGQMTMRTENGLELRGRAIQPLSSGTPALAVIRHPRVQVAPVAANAADGPNQFAGRIELINYLGDSVQYVCSLGEDHRIIATAAIANAGEIALGEGDDVRLSWAAGDCLIVEDASEVQKNAG
jgi:ABC-type Fe3+/spermidine/putrescine transport system ATPase subunit